MRKTIKRVMIFFVSFILIIIGVAGLFLPILPGWAFIILGLIVLSKEYEVKAFRKFLDWVKKKRKEFSKK